jgi:hypothetical protein
MMELSGILELKNRDEGNDGKIKLEKFANFTTTDGNTVGHQIHIDGHQVLCRVTIL